MEQQNTVLLRKRKFLVILPVLVLPFVLFTFWALGGGKGTAAAVKTPEGLNMELPGANLKKDAADKLAYYRIGDRDSEEIKELIKTDPYASGSEDLAISFPGHPAENLLPAGYARTSGPEELHASEARIYDQLRQLNEIVKSTGDTDRMNPVPTVTAVSSGGQRALPDENVDRLELMMKSIHHTETERDSELTEINGVLDRILDIQHPERISKMNSKESSGAEKARFTVSTSMGSENMLRQRPPDPGEQRTGENPPVNRFYSLPEKDEPPPDSGNAIQAVVHESRTLVSGSILKLRLLQDIYMRGMFVPKGDFIFGMAYLSGERLNLTIKSIRCNNSLVPVDLTVYDMDGLEGIYIPGTITRDATGQAASGAVQNLGMDMADPNLAGRVMNAGLDAGKRLVSKRARLIRVRVKAGYRVLLKNNLK
jgi:conjugative transposon TraM protein